MYVAISLGNIRYADKRGAYRGLDNIPALAFGI